MSKAGACQICDTLPPQKLMELDAIIGDPAAWPITIWGIFEPPKGQLSASYRRHGATAMARDWLDREGIKWITMQTIRKHVRFDVVHIPRDASDLIQLGIVAEAGTQRTRIPTAPTIDAGAFIRYFNAGIQMGEAATRLLAERINAMIERGEEPDPKLVMKLADMGAAFARSQAALMARGLKFGEEEDDDAAFMGSDEERPGPRIGHSRVKMVDGERRPVHDEGPADRAKHRKRREAEGLEDDG